MIGQNLHTSTDLVFDVLQSFSLILCQTKVCIVHITKVKF